MLTLLRTTTKTYKEIAKELNIAESSVKKINYGKMHFDPNIDYPIRKKNCFTNSIDEICYDLINTKLKFTEISKKYNKSTSTISRINKGGNSFQP